MTATPAAPVAFRALVAALGDARVAGIAPGDVRALAHDSRAVAPGSLFVALRGTHVDGHEFLERAIERGASAVVVDRAFASAHALPPEIATIVVPDTRVALSRLAAAFFCYPARALAVAGITGTNGKTTTAALLAAMLAEAGIACGTIGTLGASFGDFRQTLANTTPLALELQALLAEMRDRDARAVAMEVSSHALALDRVADVPFRATALTNVTRDHLDFHESFEAYAAAKRLLFVDAPVAVLNADDAHGERWAHELRDTATRVVTYAIASDADVRATDVAIRADGSTFVLDGHRFATRLPGRFNVSNALAAIGLARTLGGDDVSSARALAAFQRVPGRMEHLAGGGIDVLVDYAHTPDALAVVLQAARETTHGKLIVVFGCGGDRDRGKRPQMGRIASELADRAIVTSDNPRSEDPDAIAREIVAGIPEGAHVTIERDRRRAIGLAIAGAARGDVVVVAGKGHEDYQIVGTQTLHFDDREEVRAALALRAEATP
jgi:UDP-N-acetylmuramoyl-L-alanyl-D-glutamate--2,6-diaminopimelate ligase